jgi:hypothetical protein
VGLTCQRKMIKWMTPQEIFLFLLNLLSVIHLEWTGDGGVFIPLPFIQNFLVGQMDLLRSSVTTSSDWWPPLLPFSHLFLWFITDNQLLYSWKFSRVNKEPPTKMGPECLKGASWCILSTPIPFLSLFFFLFTADFYCLCSRHDHLSICYDSQTSSEWLPLSLRGSRGLDAHC